MKPASFISQSVHVADQVDAATDDYDGRNGPKQQDWHFNLHQFDVQTLTVFMPDSASARVL